MVKALKKKLHIDMATVAPSAVRQPQADDWYDPTQFGNNIWFTIQSIDLKNTDMEFLVMVHALVESYLCFRRGITDKQVSEFDAKHLDVEPGEMPEAPYYREHMLATDIESALANALNIDWIEYGNQIEEAVKKWKKKK